MLERLTETRPSERGDAGVPSAAQEARRAARASRPVALPYFLVLAVLAPLAFFGLAAAGDWRAIEEEARDRIVYIGDAIAEHAQRVFATHELVAVSIRERIAGMSWAEIRRSQDLHAYLARVEADFEEVRAIWLVDGEGRLRASSRTMPAPAIDVSGSDWFAAARASGGDAVVSPPEVGGAPVDGGFTEEVFTLTLPRRDGAEGEPFGGLVRIAIAPGYFRQFYADAYPDEGLIALVLASGEVLVSHPPGARLPSRLGEGAAALERMSAARGAVWEGRSVLDGAPRIHAVSRVGNLPVFAAFAIDQASLEAAWRSRLADYVVYFVPAVAALLFLGALAWRSHRALEEKVELRTRALSEAVAEKNQLLKEVHHRVKNNMQIVSSLIRMQERVDTSPEDTIRRVQAMALVHDLIYSHGEFASVNLGAYVRRLTETLSGATQPGTRVAFAHDLDHVAVTLDRAMPFALILSEVLTNTMRHAFPEGEGHVAITLDRLDGHAVLRVEDDGQGFDPQAHTDGFGLKLIRSLAVQLDARVRFEEGRGTVFVMEFPLSAVSQPA